MHAALVEMIQAQPDKDRLFADRLKFSSRARIEAGGE